MTSKGPAPVKLARHRQRKLSIAEYKVSDPTLSPPDTCRPDRYKPRQPTQETLPHEADRPSRRHRCHGARMERDPLNGLTQCRIPAARSPRVATAAGCTTIRQGKLSSRLPPPWQDADIQLEGGNRKTLSCLEPKHLLVLPFRLTKTHDVSACCEACPMGSLRKATPLTKWPGLSGAYCTEQSACRQATKSTRVELRLRGKLSRR